LEKITRRIDTGELKPVVGQVVPLERIRDAFTAKAGGGVPGKVVLKVGGDSV
jgi:NADPH:quinone reductase-like Zn-dependent oxidoreductase